MKIFFRFYSEVGYADALNDSLFFHNNSFCRAPFFRRSFETAKLTRNVRSRSPDRLVVSPKAHALISIYIPVLYIFESVSKVLRSRLRGRYGRRRFSDAQIIRHGSVAVQDQDAASAQNRDWRQKAWRLAETNFLLSERNCPKEWAAKLCPREIFYRNIKYPQPENTISSSDKKRIYIKEGIFTISR